MEVFVALVNARHEATLSFLAAGTGDTTAEFYEGDTLLLTVVLAKPCGTVADGLLTLHPSLETMVTVSGVPDSCLFRNGNGAPAFRLTVSGLDGDGEAKIESDFGATLYAGGFARLVGGVLA